VVWAAEAAIAEEARQARKARKGRRGAAPVTGEAEPEEGANEFFISGDDDGV